LFGCTEQVERAAQVREHAAAVDVGDEDYRAVDRFGKAHVGDIAVAQVDFRRAAGTFGDDQTILRRQPTERLQHVLHRLALVVVVAPGLHVADGLALHDDLRAAIRVRFQQDRVHVGVRFEVTGLCLYRLCAADLAAVDCHRAVQRHVLRLERRDPRATARQCAAEAGDQGALAGIRCAALHHQAMRCAKAVSHRSCQIRRHQRTRPSR
jgi:hypothetical protein